MRYFANAILKKLPIAAFVIIFLGMKGAYALTPYSNRQLDELEKEFIQQINLSDDVIREPLANAYVNHLGQRLADAGSIPASHFFIVRSNEINAFAGPGGHIGINSQLILATDNESELAAVMSHELAHVRLHHLYRMMEHQKQMRVPMLATMLAAAALGALSPTLASGALMASMTGFAQDSINYTRSNEKEADRIGIDMLIDSGFNPRSMASFFKKMQQSSRYYYTANIPAILRSHPLDDDRIAEAENRSMSVKNTVFNNPLEYYLFKELIRNSIGVNSNTLIQLYTRCLKKNNTAPCSYGYALTLINNNQPVQAIERLNILNNNNPDNLFYQLALGQAYLTHKEYREGMRYLREVYQKYPNNYAAIRAYAQGLLSSNQASEAVMPLIKGFRLYKKDLPMCESLAIAQAQSGKKAYAYFTQAQCQMLQGRNHDALHQLTVAKKIAKNDTYLCARADALMQDIKNAATP